MEISVDHMNRLSIGMMEKYREDPEKAMKRLEALRVQFVCNEAIRTSVPLQAALLTAINCGKRAFLGGVYLHLPKDVACLLPWAKQSSLNEIVVELGAITASPNDPAIFCIGFGVEPGCGDNGFNVVCNDWQAGILLDDEQAPFESTGTVPTAGIFAGAYSIALSFLKLSGVSISCADVSQGISLWRPDLPWTAPMASGPSVTLLPKRYWLLGLGHLGQAYAWNIGLLPYGADKPVVVLQDDERIVNANWSAGALCESKHVGKRKTRIVSEWLEGLGFDSFITERRFDINTKRAGEEPYLALCGFDNATSRLLLEKAGFDLIVESGLGSDLGTFDLLSMHTFPGGHHSPAEIWQDQENLQTEINEVVFNILDEYLKKEPCGIVPLTLATKSVSACFVGMCSGAIVIAELLRGLHGGKRYDHIIIHLRNLMDKGVVLHRQGEYTVEQGKNGFVRF